MKKILGFVSILTVIAILSSCATAPVSRTPNQVPSFSSTDEINEWIYDNIQYDNVLRNIDEKQTPEETLSKGTGVCIDMCDLFIFLANKNGFTNYNCKALPVEVGKNKYHVVVECALGIYDPTNDKWYMFLPDNWKVTTWD